MQTDGKELYVCELGVAPSGQPYVIGIPNNGAAITVGDVFTSRYDVPWALEDILNELPRPAATSLIPVQLIVSAIEWPRGLMATELPAGHAGVLHLTGDGMESVNLKCLLMT
jgi:hypothetical protein